MVQASARIQVTDSGPQQLPHRRAGFFEHIAHRKVYCPRGGFGKAPRMKAGTISQPLLFFLF
ncbi:hypothetical protein [Shinella sp. M31]|uniref:hypothetical protein n=1 Tax=Shinella sp. M31 TaxID=3368615 RepID=UPI003B9EFACD